MMPNGWRALVAHDSSIWFTAHHLIDQSAERADSSFIFASTQDSTAPIVSGRQLRNDTT